MYFIFIDTNIWLKAYIDQDPRIISNFRKLAKIKKNGIDGKKVKILINECVYSEFNFNKRNKYSEIFKNIEKSYQNFMNEFNYLNSQIGKFLSTKTKEYIRLEEYKNEIRNFLKKGINDLKEKIISNKSDADFITKEFFKGNDIEPVCELVIKRAKERSIIGKGPGKNYSNQKNIGDEINWEWLLKIVPDKKVLYFVSEDGDFSEFPNLKFNGEPIQKFNIALENEWRLKKGSNIMYFSSLDELLREFINQDENEIRNEVQELVNNLENSDKFDLSRDIISDLLLNFDFLNIENMISICKAFMENNQVYWISKHEKLKELYNKIVSSGDFQNNLNYNEDLKKFNKIWKYIEENRIDLYFRKIEEVIEEII